MIGSLMKFVFVIFFCIVDLISPFSPSMHSKFLTITTLFQTSSNKETEIQTANQYLKNQFQRSLNILGNAAILGTALSTFREGTLAKQPETSDLPEITNKVYFDIKIANYTEESVGTNQGAFGSGRIVIGLFGKNAPLSTALFLKTVQSSGESFPTYVGSLFIRIDEETGLLQLNGISGLNEVIIAGKKEFEYDEKLLNLPPILETSGIRHDRRGLLTRKQFSESPDFAITTRKSEELDTFHTVFGVILQGIETLDVITNLPRYSSKTKSGYLTKDKGFDGAIADSWFQSQRNFYITAGKILGDPRAVDRSGKLLRRVQIKGVGMLDE